MMRDRQAAREGVFAIVEDLKLLVTASELGDGIPEAARLVRDRAAKIARDAGPPPIWKRVLWFILGSGKL